MTPTDNPPKAAAALSAQDVTYRLPSGETLLHAASFDVEPGTILAIAGPNGAGKSTLLNLLSGALAPTSGAVMIGDRNLHQMPARDRARQIAVVGQQELPDGRLALRDYVAMGQIPIAADRSAADHARDLDAVLELTSLTALAGQPMAVLSGGERQRAHIARALAQRPTVLLLDEPTNHLDPDAKGRMLSLVAGLGITVIMILHDIVMIPEFATHLALIKSARLVDFGPALDVLTPDNVHETFGVAYLRLRHEDRMIPALDIRKTQSSTHQGRPTI